MRSCFLMPKWCLLHSWNKKCHLRKIITVYHIFWKYLYLSFHLSFLSFYVFPSIHPSSSLSFWGFSSFLPYLLSYSILLQHTHPLPLPPRLPFSFLDLPQMFSYKNSIIIILVFICIVLINYNMYALSAVQQIKRLKYNTVYISIHSQEHIHIYIHTHTCTRTHTHTHMWENPTKGTLSVILKILSDWCF